MTGWIEQTERVVFKIGTEDIPSQEVNAVVELSSITCDENVDTGQFVGSSESYVDRNKRRPYAFSVTLYVLKQHANTVMAHLRNVRNNMKPADISILRYSAEPPGSMLSQWANNMTGGIFSGDPEVVAEDLLEKYGITQANIMSFSASEEHDMLMIELSMEEFIIYDLDYEMIESEQMVANETLDAINSDTPVNTGGTTAYTTGDDNAVPAWLGDIGDV